MSAKLFKKQSMQEYRLFMEAWFFLAIARILIFWMPFRKLLPLLGRPVSQEEAEIAASDHTANNTLLEMIRISILRASRRSPWRTKCFEQALAARMMLRRRSLKSVVYFGVCKNSSAQGDKEMTAHAWLICSGVIVTGGKNIGKFTVAGRFPR